MKSLGIGLVPPGGRVVEGTARSCTEGKGGGAGWGISILGDGQNWTVQGPVGPSLLLGSA